MPKTISLAELVNLLDSTLDISPATAGKDAPAALNGLQVENDGKVHSVAAAVDGSLQTLKDAIERGADLLLLHHGLFWGGLRPITGWWREKIRLCLEHNLAVYSAHLPLDVHPVLGNNACIARELGLQDISPALESRGVQMGLIGAFDGSLRELRERYATITGAAITGHLTDPSAPAGRVAVCSGAAGSEIYRVRESGVSTFLTGEENHWVLNAAADMGMNLLFAGHYATETFGVRALASFLAEKFGLPTQFIHNPTGL